MTDKHYLDCATSPLQSGINLIEASAGTGKTHAIAMLVLRAICESQIGIDNILVVTFTRAATEELRNRIRQRLVEARKLLAERDGQSDETMRRWLATIRDRQQVLVRLKEAICDIDKASIFTIHSFCQRMLSDHALESGQLFDLELLADIHEIQQEVVEDYWRNHLYKLPIEVCAILTSRYPTPERLYQSIRQAGHDYDRLLPETSSFEKNVGELQHSYAAIQHWWSDSAIDLYAWFQRTRDEKKFKKPLSTGLERWWQSLTDYFTGTDCNLPENLHFLTRHGLKEALNGVRVKHNKQEEFLADWPLPESLISEFSQAAEMLSVSLRRNLLAEAIEQVEQRLSRNSQISFDDLITRLDRGLTHGDGSLRRLIGERYRLALIDEFQDTDSAQWRIFHILFSGPSQLLYLIGDPKQAIYRFRGADIHAYFKARAAADQQLSLANNYRSHPHLVKEVNRIFSGRKKPFAFAEDILAFQAVKPAKTGQDGHLFQADSELANMVYCQLEEDPEDTNGRWTSGKAAVHFTHYVVAETCRLLSSDEPVNLNKQSEGQREKRPLKASDIAVLVRTNSQANDYLQAFARAGVPAVVASKISVFATRECSDLLALLEALAAPGDPFRLKAAMTISWFGLSGNELQQIWQDETEFDNWFNRFLLYHQKWREDGFLAMIHNLLTEENVYLVLAESAFAERRIANIQHLQELIQQTESADKLRPGQMVLWLRSMIDGRAGEDLELRLESEEEAVRIVTMHGAKGLQYPVVFCPLLWYRSAALRGEKTLVRCHDDNNDLLVDLGSNDFSDHLERALAEELAEDLRLVYVAITRAEFRCYTMWAEVKNHSQVFSSWNSALGYLLFGREQNDFHNQCEFFTTRTVKPGVAHVLIEPQEQARFLRYGWASGAEPQLAPLVAASRSLKTDFQLSSYSAMAALSEVEDHGSEVKFVPGEGTGPSILHPGLPSGANFGNLVHDSLELFCFQDNATDGALDLLQIGRLCDRYGVSAKPQAIGQLLQTIVRTPLIKDDSGKKPLQLSVISENLCAKEMPFYFHLDRFNISDISTILGSEPTVTPLMQKTLQGYLTGYVDLFCEYDGKFYIMDYKTNHLGELQSDYGQEQLLEAMAAHNYGLQYWIYTLVVHRYLQNVLPGYDYASHFGGVLYLFVRGMVPTIPGSGVYFTRPAEQLLVELERVTGGRK